MLLSTLQFLPLLYGFAVLVLRETLRQPFELRLQMPSRAICCAGMPGLLYQRLAHCLWRRLSPRIVLSWCLVGRVYPFRPPGRQRALGARGKRQIWSNQVAVRRRVRGRLAMKCIF